MTKHLCYMGGRRSGRTYATIKWFKHILETNPNKKLFACSLALLDYAVSQGIQPSRIVWTGDKI